MDKNKLLNLIIMETKNKPLSIKIHSITDLITNSSTTIYTYSDGSDEAAINMINEFFKAFGINKKAEDIFNFVVMAEDDYVYTELDFDAYPEELHTEDGEDIDADKLKKLIEDVASGKVQKPEWMDDAENDDCNGFPPSTTLYITTKDPKYNDLAAMISKFLYSTSADGGYDG